MSNLLEEFGIVLAPSSEKVSLVHFQVLWQSGKQIEALDEMKRFLTIRPSQAYTELINKWKPDLEDDCITVYTRQLSELVTKGTATELATALQAAPHTKGELAEALISVVRRNSSYMVEILLDNGADPNQQLGDDWMALHSAVEHENANLIRLLVEKGADVNLRDQSGSTPLHVAVDIEGDGAWQRDTVAEPTITMLLMELGADSTIKNDAGKTPLDVAMDHDHKAAIQLLSAKPKA